MKRIARIAALLVGLRAPEPYRDHLISYPGPRGVLPGRTGIILVTDDELEARPVASRDPAIAYS
jgi:hypothetical protein